MSIFDGQLHINVSVASGSEQVVKRELISLGYEAGPANYGRVSTTGSIYDLGRLSVNLRTANRIYIVLAQFVASTFDELYDRLTEVSWRDILPSDAKVVTLAKSVKSELYALSSIQSVSKKAIVDRLKEQYHLISLDESGPLYTIEVSIVEDRVTVSLDTSGSSLNKRGYRDLSVKAPLRETLASSIILSSVWREDRVLIDPFCGSGTIPIEAAMIATHRAPNIHRDFEYLSYRGVDTQIDRVRQEAQDNIVEDRELRISGFDIDQNCISIAMHHARRAGVDRYIHFQRQDVRELSSRYKHGVIITNPPYGERLLTDKQVHALYKDVGRVYRSLEEWSMYLLTAYPYTEEAIGIGAVKKQTLYNSEMRCTLYKYLGAPPKREK